MPSGSVVALLEPYPLLAHAICVTLAEAGYQGAILQTVDELYGCQADWVVWATDDVAALVAFSAARPELPVVVLRDRRSHVSAPVLLMVGAVGIVERGSDPSGVVLALDAAAVGCVVIPREIRDEIREGFHPSVLQPLTDTERQLLVHLLHGASVHSMAATLNCSERAMYRQLERLYERLRVSGRAEAVLEAAKWGLAPIQRRPKAVS